MRELSARFLLGGDEVILTPSQRRVDALVRIVNLELQAHKIKSDGAIPCRRPQVLTICAKICFRWMY